MKRLILILLSLVCVASVYATQEREDVRKKNRYELAERFTASKLQNMLFSTTVDPHWFKSGEKFWYSYNSLYRIKRVCF